MKEKLTPHLKKMLNHEGIARQYLIGEEVVTHLDYNDPLMEDSHEVVKGLIHKYTNRALIKVSYQCAAHCRFCTRIRQIGNPEGTLTDLEIAAIETYLTDHPEIDDVILSGGDPFLTPQITGKLLRMLRNVESVKVIRIGSRLALQSPQSFRSKSLQKLLELVNEISFSQPFYILLHVNHPDELSADAVKAIQTLKTKTRAMLLSQTVMLEGINIDFERLYQLFNGLYHHGVTPYYLYHCDHVKGLERFMGDLERETEIVRKLRGQLSGIAMPTFVVDVENGYGKHPVDLKLL